MRVSTLTTTLGLFLTAGPILAQPYPSMAAGRTTAAYLQGGLSVGSSDTGAAIGAAITHDLSSRFGLEVAGGYLDRGPGIDAWTASASLLIYLRTADEDIVPYLAAGGGLYRSSFDFGDRRFGGMWGDWMGGQGAYASMYGPMYGSMYGWGGFMDYMSHPGYGFGMGGHMSSTDPVFPLGGGLRWNVSDRLSLRTDARALVVAADGGAFTVGLFTVGMGFRF